MFRECYVADKKLCWYACPTFVTCRAKRPYDGQPISGFQMDIRGSQAELQDHICKTMNDLNMRRCSLVPKNTPGADWRSLVLHVRDHPDEETFNVRCSAPGGSWCHLLAAASNFHFIRTAVCKTCVNCNNANWPRASDGRMQPSTCITFQLYRLGTNRSFKSRAHLCMRCVGDPVPVRLSYLVHHLLYIGAP